MFLSGQAVVITQGRKGDGALNFKEDVYGVVRDARPDGSVSVQTVSYDGPNYRLGVTYHLSASEIVAI
jgi:hypothetical protein